MKNALNIRCFPPELNKAAKIQAVKQGLTLRQFVINAITESVGYKALNLAHMASQPKEK